MPKTPNIINLDADSVAAIKAEESAFDTAAKIEAEIEASIAAGCALAAAARARLDAIWDEGSRRKCKAAWKDDAIVVEWFGDGALTQRQIRATRRRGGRLLRRLEDRVLKIRVMDKASKHGFSAQNLGGPLTPLRFKVFPKFFRGTGASDTRQRGSIILHELMHDWAVDAGAEGHEYSAADMRQLAKDRPRRARRNPQSWTYFALDVG